VISPRVGSYRRRVGITISDATAGATIRFTLDGTTPTTSSTVFGGEITLTQSGTVKARAFKTGSNPSAVASSTFLIKKK
jgi:hypothetical protein